MDEALEVIEVLGDFGLGSTVFRLLGLLCLLVSAITFLVLDMGFIPIPLALALVGLLLLVVPGFLMQFAELFG